MQRAPLPTWWKLMNEPLTIAMGRRGEIFHLLVGDLHGACWNSKDVNLYRMGGIKRDL